MNELEVPPAPHWYKNAIVACAPDNTLVYGSKNDIVILKEANPERAAKIQMIHAAHCKHVTSVSLNRKWNEPHLYIASVGEDNIVKIWDLKNLEKKTSSKDHTDHKDLVIGAVFAGDDRVVSATANGIVNVWNINTNTSKRLDDLFKGKVTISCLSSCPHAVWLIAFGLQNGCVVVADLRRNGQVLYKLRGHYQSVVSLSWCPAPINVFPQSPDCIVKNKEQEAGSCEPSTSKDSEQNVENKKDNVNGFKQNPWVNVIHEKQEEKADPLKMEISDFLRECDDLKNKILGLNSAFKERVDNEAELSQKVIFQEIEEQEIDRNEEVQDRPLPNIFDGDFLGDSDDSFIEELIKATNHDPKEKEKSTTDTTRETNVSDSGNETLDVESSGIITEDNKEDQNIEKSIKKLDVFEKEAKDEDKITSGVSAEKSQKENAEQEPVEEKNVGQEAAVKEDIGTSDLEHGASAESTDVKQKTAEQNNTDSDTHKKDQTERNNNQSSQDQSKRAKSTKEKGTLEGESSSTVKEPVEEEPRTEFLLASVSRDRSVYIWRAGTDGRMQTFFKASLKGKRRDKNVSTWISLCWITPDTILTSSALGEILVWPIPKPRDQHKQFTKLHFEHSTIIFNLVTPPKYFTAYNWRQDWRDNNKLNVWSWSQDGKLINYDLNAEEIRYSCTAVTASVTCCSSSTLDPNRLAIGQRDGGVRIWDLSLPHNNKISMQKFQQKFTQKISSLSWHPLKEMIVGFGTEEGRAGFFDLASKKTTMFRHYFRNHVYKVEWGPLMNDVDNLGLYVLAEGKIAIYNMETATEDPTLLELPKELYVHKFAWKPNFNLLLISGQDGSLTVLKTDLTAVTTVYLNDKGLNSIVWHPHAFIDGTDISPRCNWFAATTTKGVTVVDCDSIEQNDNLMDKIVASFEGHVKPPIALAWCPFEGERVVSAATDGLAHVLDVTKNCIIATFAEPYFAPHVVLSWSPLNPDLIIMGDKMIRIWSVTQNPAKTDEDFLTARRRLLTKSVKTQAEKGKNKIKVCIPLKPRTVPKNFIVPSVYASTDENISLQIESMKKLMNSNGRQDPSEGELDPLQLFGSKEDVAFLLDASYQQQNKDGKHKSCELIALWKGNIGEYIRNAINDNRVTPSIIALAPMVSTKLWQDACLTYAKKLMEEADSDPLETAMYFLACHRVEEAINSLCQSSMFKEALALAKHRLPENSEIISQVIQKWAVHCTNCGNFENAAYCYIAIRDYENAGKVLSRRYNTEILEFAAELAEKAGNKGLLDSIKFKCSDMYNAQEGGSGDHANIPTLEEIEKQAKVDAVLPKVVEKEDDAVSESSSTIENEPGSEGGENEDFSNEKNNPSDEN